MKHSGKAAWAALRLIGFAGAGLLALLVGALLAKYIGTFVLDYLTWALVGLWVVVRALHLLFLSRSRPDGADRPQPRHCPGPRQSGCD